MDDRRLDDIMHRLDEIERYLERHSAWHQDAYGQRDRGGCRCHCHEHRHGGRDDERHRHERGPREGGGGQREGFDEKRIVDLIVRLVGERVEALLGRYEQRRAAEKEGATVAPAPAPEDRPEQA